MYTFKLKNPNFAFSHCFLFISCYTNNKRLFVACITKYQIRFLNEGTHTEGFLYLVPTHFNHILLEAFEPQSKCHRSVFRPCFILVPSYQQIKRQSLVGFFFVYHSIGKIDHRVVWSSFNFSNFRLVNIEYIRTHLLFCQPIKIFVRLIEKLFSIHFLSFSVILAHLANAFLPVSNDWIKSRFWNLQNNEISASGLFIQLTWIPLDLLSS